MAASGWPPLEVIVTADDLGICPDRNHGIVKAARCGGITAASLMANGPAARQAVATFAADGNRHMLGLHLNVTEGRPLSPPQRIQSLLRHGGKGGKALFLGAATFRQAWRAGAIDPNELVQEVAAQLSWFRSEVGAAPAHVDGHQHFHILPAMPELVGPLLQTAGVRYTRVPWELMPDGAPPACPTCAAALAHSRAARLPYANAGVIAPQHFIGLSFCGVPYGQPELLQAIARTGKFARAQATASSSGASKCGIDNNAGLVPQVVEVMTHPGAVGGLGSGGLWGSYNTARERTQELEMLCHPGFRRALEHALGGGESGEQEKERGEVKLVGYGESQALACLHQRCTWPGSDGHTQCHTQYAFME